MLNLKKIIGGLYITSVVSLGIAGAYGYKTIENDKVNNNFTARSVSFKDVVEEVNNQSIIGTISNVDTFLSVRNSPDINGKVLDKLQNNSEVEIVGCAGQWYEIRYKDQAGFVSKDYVTINEESVSPMNNYKLQSLSTLNSNFSPVRSYPTENIELSTEEIIEMNLKKLEEEEKAEAEKAKKQDEEKENKENQSSEENAVSSENVPQGRAVKAELTAYCNDAQCSDNWSSQTAMDTTTRVGVIAAPKEVALGSKIYIPELQNYKADGIFSVEDRGGAIKIKDDGTYIIDVWMPTHEEVEAFGRKTTTIYLMDQ